MLKPQQREARLNGNVAINAVAERHEIMCLYRLLMYTPMYSFVSILIYTSLSLVLSFTHAINTIDHLLCGKKWEWCWKLKKKGIFVCKEFTV